MMGFLRLLPLSWILIPFTIGQSYGDLYKLQQSLLTNYSTSMRPLLNQSHAFVLAPAFDLVALLELNEVQQKMTVNGFLALTWKDELLTWNPRDHNGIHRISPETKAIWRPRLVLLNTMDVRDLFEDDYSPINVDFDGRVSWHPGGLFHSLCQLDLRKFPYDRHGCDILMAPMYMNASDMLFDMRSATVRRSKLIPNGEWNIEETTITAIPLTTDDGIVYNAFSIKLVVKRKVTFFIINMFCPILFLCCLNVLTFVVPVDEGEKIGFSMTVVLSMSVYMGIVSGKLPSNSENMPYMTYYIFVHFTLGVLGCIDTIFIVWLSQKESVGDRPLKKISKLRRIFPKLNAKLPRVSTEKSKVFPNPLDRSVTFTNEYPTTEPSLSVSTSDVFATCSNPSSPATENASKSQRPLQDGVGPGLPPCPASLKTANRQCPPRKASGLNHYQSLGHKLNFYSGIVFGIASVIFTVVAILILIIS